MVSGRLVSRVRWQSVRASVDLVKLGPDGSPPLNKIADARAGRR
jgi:hypothetical protein